MERGLFRLQKVSERACGHGVLGQHHSGGLPQASWRDVVSDSQRGGSVDPSLDGARRDLHSSAVCSRQEQCGIACSLSSQLGAGDRVDSPSGCLRLAPQALARDDGPLCVLSQSQLWCIFCSGLRSHGCGDGCHPAVLGFPRGVRLPSVCDATSGAAQAQGLQGGSHHRDSPVLAAEGVVSGPFGAAPGISFSSAGEVGPPAAALRAHLPSAIDHASSSCVETIKRFVRASVFSQRVARRLGASRRASSIANYQSKWSTYRHWCWEKGHSVSNPSVAKVADYLLWLWESKGLSLSSVKAHLSMLSAVFRFKLQELGEHHVLRDILRSFAVERPRFPRVPLSWDLDVVFRHLMSSEYEPLESFVAKRVGELQALSRQVAFQGPDMFVSYLPYFVAKTDRPDAPLPRSFRICSLREFAGDLGEGSLLCPVRSLHAYLEHTKSAVSRASSLFASPRSPSHQISKNEVSFFLREVIPGAGAVREDVGSLRAHSSRSVATSTMFMMDGEVVNRGGGGDR